MASDKQEVEFKASRLSDLASLTEEELGSLEEEISKEFASVGKDYIRSRMPRINQMVSGLNNAIKNVMNNEKYWMKIYNFEVDTISKIKCNTEDVALMGDSSGGRRDDIFTAWDEYEDEINDSYKNLQSPLDFDALLTEDDQRIPFRQHFSKVIRPFHEKLQGVLKERLYQENLIKENTSSYRNILWKQYYSNLVQHKNRLIDDALQKLNNLDKEYHNINRNETNAKKWKHYYKSVIKSNALKRSHEEMDGVPSKGYVQDLHYSTDNPYIKENRIELTDAKNRHLSYLNNFEHAQRHNDCNQQEQTKLVICQGLSNQEVDNDLILLRGKIRKLNEKEDTGSSKLQISSCQDNSAIERQNIKRVESGEERAVSNNYKLLLQDKSLFEKYNIGETSMVTESPHILPELPSIESFPPLKSE